MIIEFLGDSSIEIAHLGTREEIALQVVMENGRAMTASLISLGRRIFEALVIGIVRLGKIPQEFGRNLMATIDLPIGE